MDGRICLMWNPFRYFRRAPATSSERLWKHVHRGLKSDAKLLASGLKAANRPAIGSWATMLIECEIAALRAWTGCGFLSGGRQSDGETLIKVFEASLCSWLEQERKQALSSYVGFSRIGLSEVLGSLSQGWRRYHDISCVEPEVSVETLKNVVALFWGRCVEGYTNQKIDALHSSESAVIDQFIPKYISVQLQLARSLVPSVKSPQITAQAPPIQPASIQKYQPGQVWAFKDSESEPDARVTVLRVDHIDTQGTVVHISVSGINLPNGGTVIGHMPFTEAALNQSVTTLLRSDAPLPDFKAGYEQWRWGGGGIFTISIAEAIDGIRQMLASQNS